ncbi:probable arabinosyltransferase ARAD1 [Nymphaea colorata]|nr:probable arabinosyltransferase ARAD1 [Nymphaea colorata]
MKTGTATRRLLPCVFILSVCLLLYSILFLLNSGNVALPEPVIKLTPVKGAAVSATEVQRLPTPWLTPYVNDGHDVSSSSGTTQGCGSYACRTNQEAIKVFMYDLPPQFHFGLLGWEPREDESWPDVRQEVPSYPGGLTHQHSVEYWLTLDLLSSNSSCVEVGLCNAVRVHNSNDADVIFVPFFASLSYNLDSKLTKKKGRVSKDRKLQDKLVEFLMGREEWKRRDGRDHLIVAHHPNSLLRAREKLAPAMFVVADFGRTPVRIANLEKDIVAPYRHVVTTIASNDSLKFENRSTLLYFQGEIYRKDGGIIRQVLYYLFKKQKDVHFTSGRFHKNGAKEASQGMASSKFCLNLVGDTPSSNRLFDSIASLCIPVIISDSIELPFEDVLDYSEFCIFISESDALKPEFVMNLLRGIGSDEWNRMWRRIKEVAHHFEYHYPSQPGDSVQMIWEAVRRKLEMSSARLKYHRAKRFHRHH